MSTPINCLPYDNFSYAPMSQQPLKPYILPPSIPYETFHKYSCSNTTTQTTHPIAPGLQIDPGFQKDHIRKSAKHNCHSSPRFRHNAIVPTPHILPPLSIVPELHNAPINTSSINNNPPSFQEKENSNLLSQSKQPSLPARQDPEEDSDWGQFVIL